MNDEKPIFQFSATFRIKNAGRFYEEITKATGILPTDCHVSGEEITTESHNLGRSADDMWTLSSPLSDEADLSAHLRWLWNVLSPHREYLGRLIGEGVAMDISCLYKSDSDTAGFSIDSDALAVACEMNVPLEISVMIDDFSGNELDD